MLLALVVVFVVVPILSMADDGYSANGVDVLGQGIFETSGAAFKFYEGQDTNVDNLVVGNDKAISNGWAGVFPWDNNGPAVATNNLEIKKNQDSGACECCKAYDDSGQPCQAGDDAALGCGGKQSNCHDCCIKVNLEDLKVGNRDAMAFGLATATNNVKIVTNQQ